VLGAVRGGGPHGPEQGRSPCRCRRRETPPRTLRRGPASLRPPPPATRSRPAAAAAAAAGSSGRWQPRRAP
jgi:hypothetical protein